MLPISAFPSFFLLLFLPLLPALASVWLIRYLPLYTRPSPLAPQCVLLHNWNNKFSRWRLSSKPPKIALSELPFRAANAPLRSVIWWGVRGQCRRAAPIGSSATNRSLLNTFPTLLRLFHWNIDCNGRLLPLLLAASTNSTYVGGKALNLGFSEAWYFCNVYWDEI